MSTATAGSLSVSTPKGRPAEIRVGDHDRPRSVTLPGIGQVAVFDDTRRLGRMLAKDRAKILIATITHQRGAGRWYPSSKLCPQFGAINAGLRSPIGCSPVVADILWTAISTLR
jgi:hypothetical protein